MRSRKRPAAGAARVHEEDAEATREHTDAREAGAPSTPLHVSAAPAAKRVKRDDESGAEAAAAVPTPPVLATASHQTAPACAGAPRGYDGFADRAGSDAQASRGTGAAAGWTACPLCVRKLQARGKGCAHPSRTPYCSAPTGLLRLLRCIPERPFVAGASKMLKRVSLILRTQQTHSEKP